jgi:hypothetical protein
VVPDAESGADLKESDYPDFFKTSVKQVTENEVTITLEKNPVLIEEAHEISVTINKPKERHLYVFDREIMPIARTIIIGGITIEVDAHSMEGIDKAEFYIEDVLRHSDYEEPYSWLWDETVLGCVK